MNYLKSDLRKLHLLFLFWFLLPFTLTAKANPEISFHNTPLKEVILVIQNETPWFFLYRESQIADIRITINSSKEEIINDLKPVLKPYNISLLIDHERRQVFLTRSDSQKNPGQNVVIKGQIVDSDTGERLPFAAITWIENNNLSGVAANSSGTFTIRRSITGREFRITVSYIGYKKREITLTIPESNRIEDITVRLEPNPFSGNEIIVSGNISYNPSDSLINHLMDASRFSPLGESNSIRALKAHPSVSNGAAMNNGINIRGSTPDGFLIQLDGMSIFNQSHLFGLLDSFNDDAIQSAGFYYGIVPSNIDSPTGGTLNLITRTGSLNESKNRIGLSNTSINGTFEGPLGKRGSWLLSARASYMDAIDWFNNSEIIRWGLDINRPTRLADEEESFEDLVLRPGSSSAQFLDLHGKIYIEGANSDRWIFSSYFGGNDTGHKATRRNRSANTGGEFVFEDVETSNRWGNLLLSLKYEKEIWGDVFSTSLAGISIYQTEFDKDDFVYNRLNALGGTESVTVFTNPFRNRSSMNEVKFKQELEYRKNSFSVVAGGGWRYYLGEYSELSFDRPSFFLRTGAHLIDSYIQNQWKPISRIGINAGVRASWYSLSNEIFWSPGLKVNFSPMDPVQVFAGFSKNHQFLHRVSLENTTTADVWILTTSSQPPASSEEYTAGIQITPFQRFFIQAEFYDKTFENLRIHELNTQTFGNTFSGTPWFFQNEGKSRGAEFLLRNSFSYFTLIQTYTLSRMTFR
ncbi:MAG: carboxypeptidase-like regulatory domain-containing protein, partial [Balneolaceae bacterium]